MPSRRSSSPQDPESTSAESDHIETPSALEISRLSRRTSLPGAQKELYDHLARMVDLEHHHEFLVVPSGSGESTFYLADIAEAVGAGVDPDQDVVDLASERAKKEGLAPRIHFDPGELEDLPYQDAVFDVSIGEIGLSASEDLPGAVRELARVTRPGGSVVLILPVWTQNVDEERREVLVRRLGVRPQLLQQWKRMLREAGVDEVYAEDLSDAARSRATPTPIIGLGEFFSGRDRLSMVYRAWRRWGLRGISAALSREQEIRTLTSRERVLGLCLLRGVRMNSGEER